MAVPPEATVYHRYCPAVPPLALNVTAPTPHLAALVVVGAFGATAVDIVKITVVV